MALTKLLLLLGLALAVNGIRFVSVVLKMVNFVGLSLFSIRAVV